MASTILNVEIDYNPKLTDPEGLATAMDRLLETALSISGLLKEYGEPRIGEFLVAQPTEQRLQPDPMTQPVRMVVVEIAGGALQEAYCDARDVQIVLVDWDSAELEPHPERGIVEIVGRHGRTRCPYVTEFPTVPMAAIEAADVGKALEAAGINYNSQSDEDIEVRRRWVVYSLDTDQLLSHRAYRSREEAFQDAGDADDAVVLPLVCKGIRA